MMPPRPRWAYPRWRTVVLFTLTVVTWGALAGVMHWLGQRSGAGHWPVALYFALGVWWLDGRFRDYVGLAAAAWGMIVGSPLGLLVWAFALVLRVVPPHRTHPHLHLELRETLARRRSSGRRDDLVGHLEGGYVDLPPPLDRG